MSFIIEFDIRGNLLLTSWASLKQRLYFVTFLNRIFKRDRLRLRMYHKLRQYQKNRRRYTLIFLIQLTHISITVKVIYLCCFS